MLSVDEGSLLPSDAVVGAMAAAMAERGPDADGRWSDRSAGIILVHRRLAVLDLSPAGAQPMVSASGRHVLVFNGEVYNHQDVRARLAREGVTLRGGSDTEVLLEAIATWGVDAAIQASVGMFAFAVWDRDARRLVLARDRFGEKPLYWGRIGGCIAFASTLRALENIPGFPTQVDPRAVQAYFSTGYIPAPFSMWSGIAKLPPGHLLRIDHGRPPAAAECYWSPRANELALRNEPIVDAAAAIDQLEAGLRRSVAEQMVADVPVGCFLSGGIDSSLIAALASADNPGRVETFTVAFKESSFDESNFARAVAGYLGTRHHETTVGPEDVLAVVPRMREWYGEPFADSSQVPTALLCRWARQKVTVALSGDGADELFAGYGRYGHTLRVQRMLNRLPAWLRRLLAVTGGAVPTGLWSSLLWPADRLVGRRSLENPLSQKVAKGIGLLRCRNLPALYRGIMQRPLIPGLLAPLDGSGSAATIEEDDPDIAPLRWMLREDQETYLPGDVLTKVDRSAMAFSLETRAPFLDHRIADIAWRLPAEQQLAGGRGKVILRAVLARYLPPALFERPKMGFAMPMDVWLAGPLRDWAEDLFSHGCLATAPWVDASVARRVWQRFLGGETHLRYLVWDMLMLVSWSSATRGRPAMTSS